MPTSPQTIAAVVTACQAPNTAATNNGSQYSLYLDPREPLGVTVSVRIPSNVKGSTPAQLNRLLPNLVTQKSTAIGWHDGLTSRKEDVDGGAEIQILNTDGLYCTTGFAVETSSGLTGLVTAGHCDAGSLDYHSPGDNEYAMTYVYGRDDDWGDFAWYTTGEVEENRIYSAPNTLRDITSYEDDFDNLFIGQHMCRYGRRTGAKCDTIRVLRENVNEVLMEKNNADGGDSGGPWYSGNKAYGVHEGEGFSWGYRDKWSTVSFLDDSMAVTVLTD